MVGNQGVLGREKKILITSALPYVNNVPHLGNIIGCVLSADVFARFCRSWGCETLFICGTDEHGTTSEVKAREEGITVQEVCDKYHLLHKEIYEWFLCSFDHFGRTTSPENEKISLDIFAKLDAAGYILEDELEQMYDEKEQKFLADRFVEGECPKCSFKDARGDQCDGCGALLNPGELINPVSKLSGSTPVVRREKHLFIDLPKLAPQLESWIAKASEDGNWSHNAIAMTKAWLRDGLKPRCISRDLKWGIHIPKKGYEEKVFYSWFDAPIGYIGATAELKGEAWQEWWQKPKEVELYQFMGKDNVPFHTIMFPSFLIGTGEEYTLLHQISSTEYMNYESGKFSKSRGVGVFGDKAMKSGILTDVWRYYLLSNRPESSDSVFTWDDFLARNNNELLANLGNFVNRTLTFIEKHCGGVVSDEEVTDEDWVALREIDARIEKVTVLLSEIKLREALAEVMAVSRLGNVYFQEQQPWKLVKQDMDRAKQVLWVCANIVRRLGIIVEPFLPETSCKIFDFLRIEHQKWGDVRCEMSGHKIGKSEYLFKKFDEKEIEKLRGKFGGKSADELEGGEVDVFSGLDLRVGQIVEVEAHADATNLWVCKVNIGKKVLQIISGTRQFFEQHQLVGRKVIVVANLAPAVIRGVKSEGMMLCAEAGGGLEMLAIDCENGERVVTSTSGEVAREVAFKAFTKLKFGVVKTQVCYKGEPLMVCGKGVETRMGESAKIS